MSLRGPKADSAFIARVSTLALVLVKTVDRAMKSSLNRE